MVAANPNPNREDSQSSRELYDVPVYTAGLLLVRWMSTISRQSGRSKADTMEVAQWVTR